MKNLKVTFYQANGSYSFSTEVNKDSLSTFVGTSLNRMIDYSNVARKIGARVFSFNKPINLLIEVEGKAYNTGICSETLQAKLKCQRTNAGYTRYAKRVFELIKFATMDITEVTFVEVIKSLE